MKTIVLGVAAGLLTTAFATAASAQVGACLITKTETNPFFVKMKEGAQQKADELGITLNSYAGKVDGDHESQVAAIETCIANGASGILLTASDTSAIVNSVKQGRKVTCTGGGKEVHAIDVARGIIEAEQQQFANDQRAKRLREFRLTDATLNQHTETAAHGLTPVAMGHHADGDVVLLEKGFHLGAVKSHEILAEGIVLGGFDAVGRVRPVNEETAGMQLVVGAIELQLAFPAVNKLQTVPIQTGTIDFVIRPTTLESAAGH